MAARLSIVAPCLNEEKNVDALVDPTLAAFSTLPVSAELLLVDDGSADGTWERISQRATRDERVVGVRHASNLGIEASWRSGLERASGDVACLIDADLQNRPEDIARLYQRYTAGDSPDVVQAVRNPAEGVRRLLGFSRALNVLLNVAGGTRLRDNKSGFILSKRTVLADILGHRLSYRYFQSFIGVSASARGYRIAEVDTVFDQRRAGQSFLSAFPIWVSLRIVIELVKIRWELRGVATSQHVAHTRRSEGPLATSLDVERWNDQFGRENDIDDYYAKSSAPIRWIEHRRLSLIRSMVAARAEDRLLEVGCGGGHVLRMFAESDLTGVDVSGAMLQKARRNLQGYRVVLLKGDLNDLALPDATFDKIICTEVLEHTVDPGAILSQIQRLIRPGGRIVITFPNDRVINAIKAVLRRSGLTRTPLFRRVSWGADHYHLHVWSVAGMRSLLQTYFTVVEERSIPGRFFPIRCCFQCAPRSGNTKAIATPSAVGRTA